MPQTQPKARSFEEQRVEPRQSLALPLRLGTAGRALTRDISASGMFFEIEGSFVDEGPMTIELQLPETDMTLRSIGCVVRMEHAGGKTGVAVRLVRPALDIAAPVD